MNNKPDIPPTYRVWNKNNKEFVDCGRSEDKAFQVASKIKSTVWMFHEEIACAMVIDKKYNK